VARNESRCGELELAGVASVAEAFEEFARWLNKEHSEKALQLTEIANGFEGWLKIEFLLWLARREGCGCRLGGPDPDVGVEYKLAAGGEAERKQCDLWVRSSRADRFHYVEFKAPFANKNAPKMLRWAGTDLWYMANIHAAAEQAASGSTIIVGVGFNAAQWEVGRECVRTIAKRPGLEPAAAGTIAKAIRWDVWTVTYV
jgi:hypothetical protein